MYSVEEKTVKWARQRFHELSFGAIELGRALKAAEEALKGLEESGNGMINQPESDFVLSYAYDLRKLIEAMKEKRDMMVDDKTMLEDAIGRYEKECET